MIKNVKNCEVIIYLLNKEIEALRSVLSEWDQDKTSYLQMGRANDIAEAISLLDNIL